MSDFQKYFKSDCVCLWDVVAFLPCQHQPQRTQQAHSCGGQLWFAGRRQLARPRCQFDRLRRQLISRFLLLAPLLSAHTENIKLYYFTLNKRQISLKLRTKGVSLFLLCEGSRSKKVISFWNLSQLKILHDLFVKLHWKMQVEVTC